MKVSKTKKLIITLVSFSLVLIYCLINDPSREITLTLGLYAGSSWDVPNGESYQVIDQAIQKFEKKYPNVHIEYKSGIMKDDYSSWLANEITKGTTPDLFMVLSSDFNTLSSIGILKDLNRLIKEDQIDTSIFYQSAMLAGNNNSQYALPYEINPTIMCINHDLLTKENIEIPSSNWTIDDFYKICTQVTKDTNNDGVIDQYGCYGFDWKDAIDCYGLNIFEEDSCHLDKKEVKEALSYLTKINELSKGYQISSEDFDQGKVAFCPLTFAQYRTYQPYPYRISKYTSFRWSCIPMPGTKTNTVTTHLDTSLIGMSSQTKHSQMAWEFLKMLTMDEDIQQSLLNNSKGASPLKKVMLSKKTKEILDTDTMSNASLNQDVLNNLLENTIVEPKFKEYESILEKADYLINLSLNQGTIDNDLNKIQKKLENELK